MELEKRSIWAVMRIIKGQEGELEFETVRAYTTLEEALEELKKYKTCLGDFGVFRTEVWFPPEF